MFTFEFDHYDWLSEFYIECRQTSKLVNLKISADIGYPILVKIWKWLKFFNSVPFLKKTLENHVYNWIWSFYWLSQFYSKWSQTSRLVNLKISAKVLLSDFGQNLKMTKTS